jgi:hypothetical protein
MSETRCEATLTVARLPVTAPCCGAASVLNLLCANPRSICVVQAL